MIRIAVIALSLIITPRASVSLSSATEPDASWRFTDIKGKRHHPFDDQSTLGIALIFISTDCPIANSYQPLLQRLAVEHGENGIRMFLVHPNPELTVVEAEKHARDYKVTVPIVIDSDLSISRRVGARVTPEAFVLIRDHSEPVYQGRIDNRYARYGRKRRAATSHELADTLDAVIAGLLPVKSRSEAVGCFISYVK